MENDRLSWRRAAWAVFFSPILVGFFLFIGIFAVWKLPMLCCQRLRAVRSLPLAGLFYYSMAIAAATASLHLAWWAVLWLIVIALGGEWLLPDPVSFLFNPQKRSAIIRAVEFIEQQDGSRALYGMAAVVGSESGRAIVSVGLADGYRPCRRRFVAVGVDGSTEELSPDYVEAEHGVRPWR